MFTTSMPLSAAYVSASTVGCRKKKPESCPARMLTSVTFGATPAMPSPFSAAATVPGDVRAVAVVVLVDRVDAARVLARAVDVRDVGDEVARERVEVRRDVGMRPVHAGVDDADPDAASPGCFL